MWSDPRSENSDLGHPFLSAVQTRATWPPGPRVSGFAGVPHSPYSVGKFLILKDLANRLGAKILRTLGLAAESSQERTYGSSLVELFARPSFYFSSIVQEAKEIICKVTLGSLRLIGHEQETGHRAGEVKLVAVEVCGLLPFHEETVDG